MKREEIEFIIKQGNFRHPELVAPQELVNCEGYIKLKHDVLYDYAKDDNYQNGKNSFHNYAKTFEFAINKAMHYSENTGIKASDILDSWERDRSYWYMNYYQECNMPEIKGNNVRVFDNADEFRKSVGKSGFRCPNCDGISTNPNICDTHRLVAAGKRKKKECDWVSYGLFGTMGKGANVFLKDRIRNFEIFMPVAWEETK